LQSRLRSYKKEEREKLSKVCQAEPAHAELEQEILALLEECRAPLLQYAAGMAGSADAARDALQEASLRYFLARRSGVVFENPRAWLFSVARHYIVDQMRKQLRQANVGEQELTRIADPGGCPDQAYQHTYLDETIGRTLSPRERVCIRHRLNGLSYEDISRSMGISTNTVGVLINRAFKKVRAA
jgi:RNA polymerase sigma-70 factor (ECF subfamily)